MADLAEAEGHTKVATQVINNHGVNSGCVEAAACVFQG
jgi:hypothetical protein